MGELTHAEGIGRDKRIARSQNGDCPICGDSYSTSRRVENTDADADCPMFGLAYVHYGGTECVEWASGVTQRYDGTNDKITQ